MSNVDIDELLTREAEKIVDMVKESCGKRVAYNLELFTKLGKIHLELPGADLDNETWTGELLIYFDKPMTAEQVVNHFITRSGADEIEFINEYTLRLWWD